MYYINIPPLGEKYRYKVTTANRTLIGNKNMEFVQDKEIELSLLKIENQQLKFRYRLINHKMENSALIHQWADDIEVIYQELILLTNVDGVLMDIENFREINTRWIKLKGSLKKKYPLGVDFMIEETTRLLKDKNRFMETFIGYSFWRAFFQGWFKEYEKEEKKELVLKKYFGTIDLPLILNSRIESRQGKYDITFCENTAELNKKKFNRKAFARMLKDLTDIYNIDASLSVDMEEKYHFSEKGVLQKADIFLETYVNQWYSVSNAHQIQIIEENTRERKEKDTEKLVSRPSIFLDNPEKKNSKGFFIKESSNKK
ncbi:hypothetical protein [Apibacter adventoris]|uniref:hypothetical protein n=1 Tax=Apibacter adventoris TaxID=1679466 RepID=UPI000CF69B36|nr:hypothetical protein [Apibacter adventoris]PQL92581.1 hypothetical protein C4S76_10945 [Apibacter adventoris]